MTEHQTKRAIAMLPLCLYTGRKIRDLDEDLGAKTGEIIKYRNKGKICRFITHLDITPLRIKATNTHQVIANQDTKMSLPLPAQLVHILHGERSEHLVSAVIKPLKQVLNMSVLSQARIATVLYSFMSRNTHSSQIASIITGRNLHHRADLWHCSQKIGFIHECYAGAINNFATLTHGQGVAHLNNTTITDNQYIGSQNCPSDELASRFFYYLQRKVVTTMDFIGKFNAYNLWLWYVFLLLGSLRAVNDALGMLGQFNLTAGLAWISDKEGRASSESQRLVPMCDFLVQAVQDYLEWLEFCKQSYGRLDNRINIGIEQVLTSQRPLLNIIYEQYELQSLSPKIIKKHLGRSFRFKEDWPRHLGQKHLHEQGVDENLILSVFGHEMSGQESWQKHSSISLGDVMELEVAYQNLAVKLKLEQVA